MRILTALMASLLLGSGWLTAQAATIDRVTVYPDRAEVVRIVEIDHDAGDSRAVISDLPEAMDPDSLRVRAATDESGLRIAGIDVRTVRGVDRTLPQAQELESRIEELELDKRSVENRIRARDLQLQLLDSFAGGRAGEDPLDPATLAEALDKLGESSESVLSARLEQEREREQLQREIDRLGRALEDLGQERRDTREARLDYSTEGAGQTRLEVSYTVSDSGWEPLYDWRLDTGSGRLNLTQRAAVRQGTGEDWTDAAVSVSLGQPALGGQIPRLSAWYIDIADPDKARTEMAEMDRVQVTATRAQAVPEGTEMATAWRIPGRIQVPGDNSRTRFELADYQLQATVGARTVPRRQARAWLFAEAEYEGETWLPPGPATLYQDGALAGQTHFDGLSPGDTLEAGFGVAERIDIDYRVTRDTRGTDGVVRRQNRLEREFAIKVDNRYDREMEITVIDQMPVARDERIDVDLTDGSRRPDERGLDGESGVVAWKDTYEAGESREIRFGYRATFPRDVESLDGWD